MNEGTATALAGKNELQEALEGLFIKWIPPQGPAHFYGYLSQMSQIAPAGKEEAKSGLSFSVNPAKMEPV